MKGYQCRPIIRKSVVGAISQTVDFGIKGYKKGLSLLVQIANFAVSCNSDPGGYSLENGVRICAALKTPLPRLFTMALILERGITIVQE